MSELHTQSTHGSESRVIPQEFESSLPLHGSAPADAEPTGISRRRAVDHQVRMRLERLTGADPSFKALVLESLALGNRECAARRAELRQSEVEVRRLHALVIELGGDPNV